MKIKYFFTLSLLVLLIAFLVFYSYFSLFLGYELSDKVSDWVDFSDYINGVTTPILSFISIVLLIHSLNLQNEANSSLRSEIKQGELSEKMRMFESYFFNMIDSQRKCSSDFKVNDRSDRNKLYFGIDGVIEVERIIADLRNNGYSDKDISEAIEDMDYNECIYNSLRVFNNIFKVICSRLSDEEGFSIKQRKEQMVLLINFTEFYQFRLILICMQFLSDYPASESMSENSEFLEVLSKLGVDINPY